MTWWWRPTAEAVKQWDYPPGHIPEPGHGPCATLAIAMQQARSGGWAVGPGFEVLFITDDPAALTESSEDPGGRA